jgi:biotin carboxylase
MRLMMLGASLAQLPGIRLARSMGHEVVTCDDRADSIGHQYGTHHAWASTFDPEAVFPQARMFSVDGVMTMGTDQPVLTAAIVAQRLGLPSPLSVHTARAVTDKRFMKGAFEKAGIPTVPWTLLRLGGEAHPRPVSDLPVPLVVKPVDSQGQRGLFLVPDAGMARARLPEVLAFSRTDEMLVESHYPNEEVTVSGWVMDGQAVVLSITDRVTFPQPDRLGICLSHELPSRHMRMHGDALLHLTRHIAEVLDIRQGPLYFQFLIGDAGIRVNEVACRIGGAFESQFLPRVTGFDLTAAAIRDALGLPHPREQRQVLETVDVTRPGLALSVQLFFAEPCTISRLTPLPELMGLPGVVDAGYHVSPGHVIRDIRDATARVGYCIVEAGDPWQLEQRLQTLYGVLAVMDGTGRNRIVHRPVGEAWMERKWEWM